MGCCVNTYAGHPDTNIDTPLELCANSTPDTINFVEVREDGLNNIRVTVVDKRISRFGREDTPLAWI